jgi:hypothetical protein
VKVGYIMHDGRLCVAEAGDAHICSGMGEMIFIVIAKFCAFNVVGSDECEDVKGSSVGREGHDEVHAGQYKNRRSVSD